MSVCVCVYVGGEHFAKFSFDDKNIIILGECSALWGERERVIGHRYMLSGY